MGNRGCSVGKSGKIKKEDYNLFLPIIPENIMKLMKIIQCTRDSGEPLLRSYPFRMFY